MMLQAQAEKRWDAVNKKRWVTSRCQFYKIHQRKQDEHTWARDRRERILQKMLQVLVCFSLPSLSVDPQSYRHAIDLYPLKTTILSQN